MNATFKRRKLKMDLDSSEFINWTNNPKRVVSASAFVVSKTAFRVPTIKLFSTFKRNMTSMLKLNFTA